MPRFDLASITSGLPLWTDALRALRHVGFSKTRSNNELNCTRCTVLFRIAIYNPAIIIAVLVASSNEASARCNRDGIACAGVPTARAKDIDARQHRRHLIVRIGPVTTGCYGFDHGPVYSPALPFSYNCEMFDGPAVTLGLGAVPWTAVGLWPKFLLPDQPLDALKYSRVSSTTKTRFRSCKARHP
jgi:hypothetical protein